MKKLNISIAVGALGLLLLASCSDPVTPKKDNAGSGWGTKHTLTASIPSASYKYYSLTTGEEVTGDDIATDAWDIGLGQSLGNIVTNSGVTATAQGSGGDGGVWYTGSTDFSTKASSPVFTGDWAQDKSGYVFSAQSNTSSLKTINVFTKLSWSGEGEDSDPADSDPEDAFTSGYSGTGANTTDYNADQFYSYNLDGANTVAVTNKVYVVRHGDGEGLTKVQVVEYVNVGNRDYTIYYSNKD